MATATDLLNWLIGRDVTTCRRGGTPGMYKPDLKQVLLTGLAALLLLPAAGCFNVRSLVPSVPEQLSGPSAAILNKYLQATQMHEDVLRGASMDVEINASVPKLKEQGKLHALRKISKVGQITYHVLAFQGDNTIKNQVIGRYLQAEQQGQGDQSLAITPTNYKFRYKGEKPSDNGKPVYVFELSPRKKKVGLFKGEMWLDAQTYLPVYEKGQFVKNPSIFFKKVDFQRAFTIKDGVAIPQYMTSTIDARLIGKVELDINYSNFAEDNSTSSDSGPSAPTASFAAVK